MAELMSDALFGVDGTELPRLSSDPSGRGGWRDGGWPDTALPPLPPIPELGMTQKAIAAALGEDVPEPAEQQRTAAVAAAAPSAPPVNPAPPSAHPPSRPPRTANATPTVAPAPSPPRGAGGPRYRPTLVTKTRPLVQLRVPRRRATQQGGGIPTQTRSNGGASAFFVLVLIVFAVLLYFIIAGIVESIVRLLP